MKTDETGKKFYVSILFICTFQNSISIAEKTLEPKIITNDGNLKFQSAANRNITFDVGANNDILFGSTSIKAIETRIENHEIEIEHFKLAGVNPCTSQKNKCSNFGTCVVSYSNAQGYICVCKHGYAGEFCTEELQPCTNYVCNNGGRCAYSSIYNIHRCICNKEWYGPHCTRRKPAECKFAFENTIGVISSPGFPSFAPSDFICTWKLTALPGMVIELFLDVLNIGEAVNESTEVCTNDFLHIQDNMNYNRKFCGDRQPQVLSLGNEVSLTFSVGRLGYDSQFSLLYHHRQSVCGGHLASPTGRIRSPSVNGTYASCKWVVGMKSDEKLQLRFTNLIIENARGMCNSYLEIRDGPLPNSPLVQKVCHHRGELNMDLVSSQSHIVFVSVDGRSEFHGLYEIACGGVYYLPQGGLDIKSPLYPHPYPAKKFCTWMIKSPLESSLAIRFLDFNIGPHPSCLFDYVTIIDGVRMTSPKLATYCGNIDPLPVITSDQNLMMVFQTDGDGDFRFKAHIEVTTHDCGGIFTGFKGLINMPSKGATNSVCLYTISADNPNNIILLSFNEFSLNSNCSDEYIQIFNGVTATGTLGGSKYCGSRIPPVTTSNQRSLTVKYYARHSNRKSHFFALWNSIAKISGCDVEMSGENGNFSSLNYPYIYAPNLNCKYKITVENGHRIQLTFDAFHLEDHGTCQNDVLKIYDGGSPLAPLVGKFCGTRSPRTILSSSNMLYLQFISDHAGEGTGFHASYISGSNMCGGTLHSENGFISSPNFPNKYSANEECIWIITAEEGNIIDLTIQSIDLEPTPCTKDFIRIYDGENKQAGLLGELCGNQSARSVYSSSGHHLLIEFRSDATGQRGGFNIHYKSSCGGTLDARSGIINTPNFPRNYPLHRECIWSINGIGDDVVKLDSIFFSLQPSPSCEFDYLKVGENKFCGSNGPNLTSTSSSLSLEFKSDYRISAKGFSLKYTIEGCSADLITPNGTFATPSYPVNYPESSHCRWRIRIAAGGRINLKISNVSIGNGCRFGNLTVYNGFSEKSPVLGQYCGQHNTIVLQSSSNEMAVLFRSSATDIGFSAAYTSLPGGCGGTLNSSSGYIYTPNYPSDLPQNTECTWLVQTNNAKSNIKLTFSSFELLSTESNNCSNNYLEVIDIHTSGSLGKYCGSSLPPPVISSSNAIRLKLVSDKSVRGKGFRAHYTQGCGGTILVDDVDNVGYITSPGFPSNYNDSICLWYLKTTGSRQIYLKFEALELGVAPGGNCNEDYIQIYNGNRHLTSMVGKYCSSSLRTVTSTGNSLYVMFNGKTGNAYKGFLAHYSSVFTGCGGTFTHYEGSIASPLFPANTSTLNTYCQYSIKVSNSSIINIEFEIFGLPDTVGCTAASLEIADGSTTKKLCGAGPIANYMSSSNTLTLQYFNDGTMSQGFKINYKSECTDVSLTANTGYIESPNFPDRYPHNQECLWRITAPAGINIVLEFQMLDLEKRLLEGGRCSDYVQLFDRTYVNMIGEYCGSGVRPVVVTSTNTALVRYKSDASVSFNGFQLMYTFTVDPSAGCFGIFRARDEVKYISSPQYPRNYPADQDCRYQIDSSSGKSIKLHFQEFQLESSFSGYCFFDNVVVFETNAIGQLVEMGTYCGTMAANKTLTSTGNRMMIQFKSDSSSEFKGFKASFIQVCGGVRTATEGVIKSPVENNGLYTANENCTWIIQLPPGSFIRLSFISLDLEASRNCTNDYVIVRNGMLPDSPLRGRYCGNSSLPTNITSSGPDMLIQFVSNNVIHSKGFVAKYNRQIAGCGGTETLFDAALTYSIMSPMYPNTVPDNIDCEWVLGVPDGSVVDFSFENFTMTPPSLLPCSSYFVDLHAGPTSAFPMIGRFCASNLPIKMHYKSKVNGMYVRFRGGTKSSNEIINFKASWKIGCGGWFKANTGKIISPLYPEFYPDNSDCLYNIELLERKQVNLFFNVFNLTNNTNGTCSENGDYLEVFDKDHNITFSLGRYCGSAIPQPIISLTSKMSLKFHSDSSLSSNGFEATFAAVGTVCGGPLYISGTFETPFYPQAYPISRMCVWNLRATTGISVELKFSAFDLESTENCTGDHVQIRNGRYIDSPLLFTLCGNQLPPKIHSSGSYMTIIFISDRSPFRGTGFKASFQSSDPGCGTDLVGSSGEITSPGYPSAYPVSIECEWSITVGKGKVIKLEIKDFRLEAKLFGTCYDFLQIREGSSLKAELCGGRENNGYLFISSIPKLTLRFKSDSSSTAEGFRLSWAEMTPTCRDVIIATNAGEIVSRGYPGYQNDLTCSWTIMQPEGRLISLAIKEFDVFKSVNCSEDSLIVRDGHSADSPIFGRYCGSESDLPNQYFQSSSSFMRLEFTSGSMVNRSAHKGFKISFTSHSAGCGGIIFASNGTITSPGYPNSYAGDLECDWLLKSEEGSVIYLYIQDMQIEDAHQCKYDSLEIRNGGLLSSPLLSHLCGSTYDAVYKSTSSMMFLRFKTDSSESGRGFKIHYNTGCGGMLTGQRGFIHTPNYPSPYPANQDCRWTVDVALDYHIRLTDLNFQLPFPSPPLMQCSDYVQIRSGLNISSPLLATFCGTVITPVYETEFHKLFLQFYSDNSTNTFRGAEAHYVAACGEHIKSSTSGVIIFPQYGQYFKNESCVWLIEYPVGDRISLKMKSLNLEDHSNYDCLYDSLEIRDGNTTDSPLFGRFCGNVPVPSFHSTSNFLYIKFVSDNSVQSGGFELVYNKEPVECGGTFTNQSGQLVSPGYPDAYPPNLVCGYRIQVPDGQRINLTFSFFNISYPAPASNSDCKNYIRVFSGPYPDNQYNLLDATCGNVVDPILSLGNSLYLLFVSEYPKGNGFVADYTSYDSGCGGMLDVTEAPQILTSPGYPGNYSAGPICDWLFEAPVNHQIEIEIIEIDSPKQSNGVCPESLLFIDGLRDTATPICGDANTKGLTIQSSWQAARLRLDRMISGKAFKLQYMTVKGCNKTITATSGLITSPSHPYNYQKNSDCHYFIAAPIGMNITIYPVVLDVEQHENCSYDYLVFHDGKDGNSPQIGKKHCGKKLFPTVVSRTNLMHLNFKTDESLVHPGFALSYTMTSHVCRGNISGYKGAITSPNYPYFYDAQYSCEWNISVAADKKISFTIPQFELEQPAQGSDCTTADYLEFFDDTVSMGQFCGLVHPAQRTSSGNNVRVRFISNNVKNNYRGFQLFYEEVY